MNARPFPLRPIMRETLTPANAVHGAVQASGRRGRDTPTCHSYCHPAICPGQLNFPNLTNHFINQPRTSHQLTKHYCESSISTIYPA